MFQDVQSFQLTIYLYGLCLAAGAALWLLAALYLAKKKSVPYDAVLLTGVLAIPMGLLFARILYCLVSLGYYLDTIGQPVAMLYFWDGGFSMMGALLGISLSALLAAKVKKVRFGELMDVLAVPAGIFIALARLGEAYTILGRGKTINTQWMMDSPFFSTREAWGDYHAVFRYEAVAAVLLVLVMLCLFFGRRARATAKPGDLALVFGSLFGSAQVVLESLRDDGHMLWGFVRASQIISILLPAAAIAVFSVRLIKRHGFHWQPLAAWLTAAAAIGLGVIKEFDIDTSNNLTREYALMSLAMAVLAAVALLLWRMAKNKRQNP